MKCLNRQEGELDAVKNIENYNYNDVEKMYPDKRFEIINGKLYLMTPASVQHQKIARNLTGLLWSKMKENQDQCSLFPAPTGLYLNQEDANNKTNNVEPDLFVICKYELTKNGVHVIGVPNLIVEILSPSTIKKDRDEKKSLFESNEVPTYWLVDTGYQTIEEYVLETKKGAYTLNNVYTNESNDEITWENEGNLYSLHLGEIFE